MIRFFNRHWSVPALLSLLMEGFLLCLAIPFATFLRLDIGPGVPPPLLVVIIETIAFLAVVLLSFYINGLYDFAERLSSRQLSIRLARAFCLAAIGLCALYFFIPKTQIGRGIFLLAFLFAVP